MVPRGVFHPTAGPDGESRAATRTVVPSWAIALIIIASIILVVWSIMIWYSWLVERVRRDFDKPFRYRVVVGQAFLCAILFTPTKVLLNKTGARSDCCGGLCTSKCMRRKLLEEDMRASTNIANTGKTVKVEV